MGGNQSSKVDQSQNLNKRQWQREQKSNKKAILTSNSNSSQILEEYFMCMDNQKEFKQVSEMYTLRKNDPELVSSHYFNVNQDKQLCSKSYNGQLYLERIPLTLSDVTDIPFPDILHVHHQSLSGYERLAKRYGNFPINEDCIGINNQNKVKVWHNHEFNQPYPKGKLNSESQMVSNIVEVIEQNTDHRTMPFEEPSLLNFMFKETNNVGFSQAKRRLEQYANQFNRGVIPSHLGCAQKVGGAQKINENWGNKTLMKSSYPYSNQFHQKSTYFKKPSHLSHQRIESNVDLRNLKSTENRFTRSQVHVTSQPPRQNIRKFYNTTRPQQIVINQNLSMPSSTVENRRIVQNKEPILYKQPPISERRIVQETNTFNKINLKKSQPIITFDQPKQSIISSLPTKTQFQTEPNSLLERNKVQILPSIDRQLPQIKKQTIKIQPKHVEKPPIIVQPQIKTMPAIPQHPLKFVQASNQIKIQGKNIPTQPLPQGNGIIHHKSEIIKTVKETQQPVNEVKHIKIESIHQSRNNSNYPSPQRITENVPIVPQQKITQFHKIQRPTQLVDQKNPEEKQILSPVSNSDSPQRLALQSQSGQSNFQKRVSSEIEQGNQSMSSLGISNVPNRTNKQLSDKVFSQIKQESIHNTTRNFYNKLMNQDESNLQFQQTDLQKETYLPKSNFNKYKDPMYSFGLKNEGTSAAFLDQLKSPEVSKPTNMDYVVESYKYTSTNQYNIPASNTYSPYNSQANNLQNYSPSYEGKKEEQNDYEIKNYDENKYENKYEIDYSQKPYKVEDYSSNYNSQKANYEDKPEEKPTLTQLDNLQMKYSVMEQAYNVQWDPEILADLQANVHNN